MVRDLPKSAFQVYEDGLPQSLTLFRHEDTPVAVGLVVDNSGSMRRKLPEVVAAAAAFARSSNPEDQMFVVNFNEHVSLGLPPGEAFVSDPDELKAAMLQIHAKGETALYDAVATALDHIRESPLQKKVLIVLSDGGDNASTLRFPEVLSMVQQSDVVVYTVGLFDEYDDDRNPGVLKQLAKASGGEALFPEEVPDVTKVLQSGVARYSQSVHPWLRPDERKAGWNVSQCSCEARRPPCRPVDRAHANGLLCRRDGFAGSRVAEIQGEMTRSNWGRVLSREETRWLLAFPRKENHNVFFYLLLMGGSLCSYTGKPIVGFQRRSVLLLNSPDRPRRQYIMKKLISQGALVMLLAPLSFAVEAVSAVHGTISRIDSATRTIVVRTAKGTEHTLHFLGKTAVHGTEAGAKDTFHGLKEGSEVVAHYTTKGAEETAVEVDKVGKDGMKWSMAPSWIWTAEARNWRLRPLMAPSRRSGWRIARPTTLAKTSPRGRKTPRT